MNIRLRPIAAKIVRREAKAQRRSLSQTANVIIEAADVGAAKKCRKLAVMPIP